MIGCWPLGVLMWLRFVVSAPAFPGLVDPIHNRVISTNEKYDDACSISLDKWAWENWEVPFCMDNDARFGRSRRMVAGCGPGKNNVVTMTIGTGIGTGVVIDGRLLYGQHFQAGSLGGHFVLDYKGRRCSCGNNGCVEALSSSFLLTDHCQEHALYRNRLNEMRMSMISSAF